MMQGLIFANVAASAATVIILLLRKFFKDKVFSKVFVLLWALVIIRLLVPFEFSSALSIYPSETKVSAPMKENNVQIQWETMSENAGSAPLTEFEPTEETAKSSAKISSAEAFFEIWLLGVVSVGGYFALCHLSTVRRIKADCAPMEEIPGDFSAEKTRFLKSKNLASPLSFGLFNPTAVIPEDISEEQLPFVLLHEHTHIKDRDAALKTAAVFALALHWFNPLVWVMVKYLDRDMERYCDERVLSKIGREKAAQYANAILDFAERGSLFASLSFFSAASLEERVISIMKNKTKRGHLPAVIAVFAATLLIMTACGTAPTEEVGKPSPENSSCGEPSYDDRVLYLYPTCGQPMCYEGDELFGVYSSKGGNMFAERKSATICASAEGTVSKVATDSENLGNYIVIDHPDGNQTLYASCGKILVEEGQAVSGGEAISTFAACKTGDKYGIKHVYFQIIPDGGFSYESYGEVTLVDISTGEMSYHHSESHHSEDHCVSSGEVSEGEISEEEELEQVKTELAEEIDKELQNAIEFVWPCEGTSITSVFTLMDENRDHNGIDIGIGFGLDIYAAAGGTVVKVKHSETDYGYHIIIDHGNGYQTLYAHCSEIFVEVGEEVVAGQIIAKTGATGNSTGPHLHFEIRINGVWSDPLEYLSP